MLGVAGVGLRAGAFGAGFAGDARDGSRVIARAAGERVDCCCGRLAPLSDGPGWLGRARLCDSYRPAEIPRSVTGTSASAVMKRTSSRARETRTYQFMRP